MAIDRCTECGVFHEDDEMVYYLPDDVICEECDAKRREENNYVDTINHLQGGTGE